MIDPRHLERTKIIQELFGQSFIKQPSLSEKTQEIIVKQDLINKQIKRYAPKFPIEKISKVDLAILQLAIYELTIEKKQPPKVIINEAVDLAREMGSDKAYAFVNAVLGKIYQEKNV